MKYFAQTLFDAVTISTANTSGTSSQYDIGEMATIWLQFSSTGTDSTTDISIQFQVSNDPMNKSVSDSTWINEGSAATYNQTAGFDKHINICAQKARVSVTRNSGAAVLTIRSVGKPTTAVGVGTTTGSNSGDVTLAAIGSSANANGASLSGQVLTLQPASASFGGVVTTAAQTFAGAKTFNAITGLGGATTTAAVVQVGATNPLTGVNQNGVYAPLTGSSANTGALTGFRADLATTAAAYTCTVAIGFRAIAITAGAASTITNAVGFLAAIQTAGGANAAISDTTDFTGNWFINQVTAMPTQLNGSLVNALAKLAVSATDGFIYLPSCTGNPSGTPTTRTGTNACVYDTANNKIWVYNGSWRGIVVV